jgi:hypothetical protein
VAVKNERGYETPEECALAGWTPEWHARVIETEYASPALAYVLVDTEPSHPMSVTCERRGGEWYEVVSMSAALPGEILPRVVRRFERLRRRRGG